VLPAAQAYPAVQLPVHPAVVSPAVDPKVPPGQSVHTGAPCRLYCPTGHRFAVGDTLPAGQAYPAVQGPAHRLLVAPAVLPYRPAAQGPLHAAEVWPWAPPKVPAGQFVHTAAPPKLYCPTPHTDAVADVDPAGQAYPAVHWPLHAGDVRPGTAPKLPALHMPVQPATVMPAVAPYRPAAQAPLHAAVPSAVVLPYCPAGQGVQAEDPAREYWPAPHGVAVADTDPAAQAYPAEQLPEQADVVSPTDAPYRPAGQAVHAPAPARL
jgi:hypothetical protein